MRRHALLLGSLLSAVELLACNSNVAPAGGNPGSHGAGILGGSALQLTVGITEQNRFEPPTLNLNKDGTVRLTLDNSRTDELHTFSISNWPGTPVSIEIPPRGVVTHEFKTPDTKGSYFFRCDLHWTQGMAGSLGIENAY